MGGAAALALVVWPRSAAAQPALDLDREFEFASGLIDLGFPDFAEKVVEQVLRLYPDQQDRAKLIRAQISISRRKFEEAEVLLKEMGSENPKAQAIRLALANAHYRLGNLDKAKQIYEEYFRQYPAQAPTDPDLRKFYQESAYQFGVMLERAGDLEGAAAAYERALAAQTERFAIRKLQSDLAMLYVRLAQQASGAAREAWLQKAQKLCEEIQWRGLDIWFGHSVMTMAHAALVRGDAAGAQKILKDHMDILRQIDGLLKEHGAPLDESPMAGARFLLGELYEQQAEAAAKQPEKKSEAIQFYHQALKEYYNVFAKYGGSDWAPEAGVRAQRTKERLEALGVKVKIELGALASSAAATAFRLADNLFVQQKYDEAAREYVKVLNQFPEMDASVAALANLGLAYARLGDDLMMKMVVTYLGERFRGNDTAAKALLALGKEYFEASRTNLYEYVYDAYLRYFPKHDRAAGVLYMLADLRRKGGDEEGAKAYYERVVNEYPQDQHFFRALTQLAWMHYAAGDYARAAPRLEAYVAAAQPGPDKARAQFMLADCYKQMGEWLKAIAAYEQLIQWVAPKDSPFHTSAAAEKQNREWLEKAAFQRGYCFAKISEPPETVPEYRSRALKAYEQFLKLFPESDLAPKAMNGMGAVYLELRQYDEAARTFDELARRYPRSEEGRSALFSLLRSAMEVKQYEVAREAFAKMVQQPEGYSAEQFALAGQWMLAAGEHAQAIAAYQQARQRTDDRAVLERALFGLGRAHFEMGAYDETVKYLEDLLTRYPKSGLFFDAKFTLGRAYRELGRLDDAVAALSDVFRHAEDPELINKANLAYAEIEEARGNLAAALASYQRVALLSDPQNPTLRPMVETSLLRSVELAGRLERYADVVDSCDQFLMLFPESDKIETIRRVRAEARLKSAAAAPAPEGSPSP